MSHDHEQQLFYMVDNQDQTTTTQPSNLCKTTLVTFTPVKVLI